MTTKREENEMTTKREELEDIIYDLQGCGCCSNRRLTQQNLEDALDAYGRDQRDQALEDAITAVSTNLNPPVNGQAAVVLMRACERIFALKSK